MTEVELREHIARQLGILGQGRSLSSEDANLIDTVMANAQGELEQLSVALWTLADVPDYAIESFVMYCAPTIAPSFGKVDEFPPQLKVFALRALRELTADGRSSTGTADYF